MADSGFRHIPPERTDSTLPENQWSYVLDRLDAHDRELGKLREGMQAAVAAGVRDGVRGLAADPEFGEAFWRKGFESMSKHAGNAGSQWIGSRLLTAAALAVLSALVAWLVKTGRI